jgi:hypothetical protein
MAATSSSVRPNGCPRTVVSAPLVPVPRPPTLAATWRPARRRPCRAHPSQGSPRVPATRSHRSRSSIDGTPDSPTRPLVSDLELGGHRAKLAEGRVSRTLAGERLLLCPERNRHRPAPLLTYTLSWGDPDRRRGIAVVRHDSVNAMTQGRARQTHRRENGHDYFDRHPPRRAAARRRRIFLQTQGLSRRGGVRCARLRESCLRHRRADLAG